jgi:ABC-2 type transport system permease protein
MTPTFSRVIWAIFRKDLVIWWRNRTNLAATIVPILGFLLVQSLASVAVGRSPVALVNLDSGDKGAQMRQIFHDADVFRITDATPEQAQELFRALQVVAVVTIPADFTQRFAAHAATPIDVTVNNLNLDFTNDIRRSVPDAITQFYQAQGDATPIKVTPREADLRPRDVQLFQYIVLPTIVLLLLMNGFVTSAIAAAREWESRTIKEMLLSPVARPAIIVGKVMTGWLTTFGLGLLVLSLSAALDWTRPEGINWLTSIALLALVALLGTGLGVAVGAALQRVQSAIPIAINVSFYMYFLSGGIGVLAFEPGWLQAIATFIPLSYGVHALEQAVFYRSAGRLSLDLLVLGLCSVAALGLGFVSMRRRIAS